MMKGQTLTMVTLSEIHTQWPWNKQAPEDLSDKEILTQRITPQEPSQHWKVALLPCMPGYAYVGYRIRTYEITVRPFEVALYYGAERPQTLFGAVTDLQFAAENDGNRDWTMFKFPILPRLCNLGQEEIYLHAFFDRPVWGKVEFLAQRFDDLLIEDSQIDYYFWPLYNPDRSGWIVDRRMRMVCMQDAYRQVEYPNVKVIYKLRDTNAR